MGTSERSGDVSGVSGEHLAAGAVVCGEVSCAPVTPSCTASSEQNESSTPTNEASHDIGSSGSSGTVDMTKDPSRSALSS